MTEALMPVISACHGIVTRMYTLDNQHYGLPRLQARHAEFEASISIEAGELLAGEISRKPLRLVQAWVGLHRDELLACWQLAAAGQKPFRIDPL